MQEHNVYQLARLADCHDPDSDKSPGGEFLASIESSTREAIDYDPDGTGEIGDMAHEIADGCVPIYTHQMYQTFVDLCAYQEDLDDIGGTSGDMERDAMTALYLIGNRLAAALIEEAREEADDDDDDETE